MAEDQFAVCFSVVTQVIPLASLYIGTGQLSVLKDDFFIDQIINTHLKDIYTYFKIIPGFLNLEEFGKQVVAQQVTSLCIVCQITIWERQPLKKPLIFLIL